MGTVHRQPYFVPTFILGYEAARWGVGTVFARRVASCGVYESCGAKFWRDATGSGDRSRVKTQATVTYHLGRVSVRLAAISEWFYDERRGTRSFNVVGSFRASAAHGGCVECMCKVEYGPGAAVGALGCYL
jgi:hypothetical protein